MTLYAIKPQFQHGSTVGWSEFTNSNKTMLQYLSNPQRITDKLNIII